MPFLRVKLDGTRFCDEAVGMELMNCYLLGAKDQGHYCHYMSTAADWPGTLVNPEEMKHFMPEERVGGTGVVEPLINTFRANTLEDLANKLGITDAAVFGLNSGHNCTDGYVVGKRVADL